MGTEASSARTAETMTLVVPSQRETTPCRQDHLTPQRSPVAGKDPRPEDELYAAHLVLDGDEHRAVPAAWMLPRHRPPGYLYPLSLFHVFYRDGGQHLRAQRGSEVLHQVPFGIDAHDRILAHHPLEVVEVRHLGHIVCRRHRERRAAHAWRGE